MDTAVADFADEFRSRSLEAILEHELYQDLDDLATGKFRDRVNEYSKAARFPSENLEELADRNLLGITISEEYGGWGANPDLNGDPAPYTQAIRTIARGCSSTAHCAQIHYHVSWLVEGIGTEDQRERFLPKMADGDLFMTLVGSEPQRESQYLFSTTAEPVDGGYVLNGLKNYATNGPVADWHIVFASLEGGTTPEESHMMFLIPDDAEGLELEIEWWDPIGMRGAVSPIIHLDDVFIPEENVLGEPGDFVHGRWQGKYHTGFTANYIGSMEGAFEFYLDYMHEVEAVEFDTVQMRTGNLSVQLEAAQSLFDRALKAWRDPETEGEEAEVKTLKSKMFSSNTAVDMGSEMAQVAGTTALFENKPLARFIRDMQMHGLHAQHDITNQTIGKSHLDLDFDSTRLR